jgi:hypothetical protein
MTEPEDETFSVGLRLGGAEIIGFHISARSTRIKRWAFFGLLTMIVVLALCDGICARVGEVRPMITALIIIAALVALLLWIDSAWWR